MITPAQIRAARAMIGLSAEELAAATGLSAAAIADAEKVTGDATVIRILKDALEDKGVLFIHDGDEEAGGPGVRLKRISLENDSTRPENLNATNDD